MKKLITYLLFTIGLFCPSIFAIGSYTLPESVELNAYPSHVELRWQNQPKFVYEIYRSDNNRSFIKCGETYFDYFFDFVRSQTKKTFFYKIVPKGINVNEPSIESHPVTLPEETDEVLLDMVQRYSTRYFYDFADPVTGMARERSNDINGNIVTTGGTGFGIMALIAGAERKYFQRTDAVRIIEKIVSFLERAERFHGAWSHWYNADTGKPFSFSKYDDGGDLVETAFMMEGLLTARQYFETGGSIEKSLSIRINQLWKTVEWSWYTAGSDSLYWHWSKNYGWKMNHRIKGFDETMITYVLASSSTTYPISKKVYDSSYKNSPYYKNGKTYYGHQLDLGMELGGPLFFTHYSFLGLKPKGLIDENTNYFDRNKAHCAIHLAYAIDNPKKHKGFGANCWGFTSSDDPLVGYTSHHPGTNDENGTISPTAAVSSIVYLPSASMEAIKHFYFDLGNKIWGKYGFYDAFNLDMTEGQQVVHSYLAIDQGPIAVMIENYRSGLIWKLFMSNDEIQNGLTKLGFKFN